MSMSMEVTTTTTSSSLNTTQVLEHTSSFKDLLGKIGSLTAVDIEYIAQKISLSAVEGLGVVGKVHVAQQSQCAMSKVISNAKKYSWHTLTPEKVEELQTQISLAQIDIEDTNYDHEILKNRYQYLDYTQTYALWYVAIKDFQKEITASFSTPQNFVASGARFQISKDQQLVGIVENIANKVGVNLTECGRNYYVHLELDASSSCLRSELVFTLTREGYGTKFNRTTFTLADLKKEFPE
jgi:hypothetical protein